MCGKTCRDESTVPDLVSLNQIKLSADSCVICPEFIVVIVINWCSPITATSQVKCELHIWKRHCVTVHALSVKANKEQQLSHYRIMIRGFFPPPHWNQSICVVSVTVAHSLQNARLTGVWLRSLHTGPCGARSQSHMKVVAQPEECSGGSDEGQPAFCFTCVPDRPHVKWPTRPEYQKITCSYLTVHIGWVRRWRQKHIHGGEKNI